MKNLGLKLYCGKCKNETFFITTDGSFMDGRYTDQSVIIGIFRCEHCSTPKILTVTQKNLNEMKS